MPTSVVQVLEAAPNPCQVSGWFLRFILTVILNNSKHPILDIYIYIYMYICSKWFSIFLGKLNSKLPKKPLVLC
jgi:hypothetical protein